MNENDCNLNKSGSTGCRRTKNLLPLYVGKDLESSIRRDQVRRHLCVCSDCRERLDMLQEVRAGVHSLREVSIPGGKESFDRELEERLSKEPDLGPRVNTESATSHSSAMKKWLTTTLPAAALMLIGLAIGFGTALVMTEHPNEPGVQEDQGERKGAGEDRLRSSVNFGRAGTEEEGRRSRSMIREEQFSPTAAPLTEFQRSEQKEVNHFYHTIHPPDRNFGSDSENSSSEEVTAVGF